MSTTAQHVLLTARPQLQHIFLVLNGINKKLLYSARFVREYQRRILVSNHNSVLVEVQEIQSGEYGNIACSGCLMV